jgi:hypothetical protein
VLLTYVALQHAGERVLNVSPISAQETRQSPGDPSHRKARHLLASAPIASVSQLVDVLTGDGLAETTMANGRHAVESARVMVVTSRSSAVSTLSVHTAGRSCMAGSLAKYL